MLSFSRDIGSFGVLRQVGYENDDVIDDDNDDGGSGSGCDSDGEDRYV